jgi:hypothetical protein
MVCVAANVKPLIAARGSRIIPPGASDLLPRRRYRRTRHRSKRWLGICGHRKAKMSWVESRTASRRHCHSARQRNIFYFPLVAGIFISVVLSALFWLFNR